MIKVVSRQLIVDTTVGEKKTTNAFDVRRFLEVDSSETESDESLLPD